MKNMQSCFVVRCAALLCLISAAWLYAAGERSCWACDSHPPVPGPRLQVDTGLTVDSINIHIKSTKVAVEYVVKNNTAHALQYDFLLYSSKYAWPGFGEWNARGNFEDLKVFIDGKETPVAHEYRAFVGAEDISGVLEQEGIKINYEDLDDFNARHREIIKNSRILNPEFTDKYFEKENFGKPVTVYGPKWNVFQRHTFACNFPPGKQLSITYAYRPFWGNGHEKIDYMPFSEALDRQKISKFLPDNGNCNMYLYEYGIIKFDGIVGAAPPKMLNIEVDWSDGKTPALVGILSKPMGGGYDSLATGKNVVKLHVEDTTTFCDSITVFAIEKCQ